MKHQKKVNNLEFKIDYILLIKFNYRPFNYSIDKFEFHSIIYHSNNRFIMINITVISFSLSFCFSNSPLFVGKTNIMSQSYFKYFNPTIFYNNNNLYLEKTTFSQGIGAIIVSEKNKMIHIKADEDKKELDYVSTNYSQILKEGNKVIIIRDCRFLKLTDIADDAIIKLYNNPTVYMTSLTFSDCSYSKYLMQLTTKATTITHICCSNIRAYDVSDGVFIYTDPQAFSFLKIIYSTIIGDGTKMPSSSKIMNFRSRSNYKLQCMNVSDFEINDNTDNYMNIHFNQLYCLSMLMNTFQNFIAHGTVYINDNDQEKEKTVFIGMCNFINNKFQQGCLCIKLNDKIDIISDCMFTCQDGSNGNFIKNLESGGQTKLYIINCFFGKNLDDLNKDWASYDDVSITLSPTLNNLAHYIVEGFCNGVDNNVSAYGCKNDTCHADKGCGENAFKFPPNDLSYTEKYHDDVDPPTPSPTNEFSLSFAFTNSFLFSLSKKFSNSFEFSLSKAFSESIEFTKTSGFSKTESFTMSKDFTKTEFFSKTKDFSESFVFSKSKGFSQTEDFTKTGFFSNSVEFTETSGFSKSNIFSKSLMFSKSNEFNNTEIFSNSFFFSNSKYFTKTLGFTQTGYFSFSVAFSESNIFEPTEDFNHTHPFTPTLSFSKSFIFSNSVIFSESIEFSKTSDFTKTKMFTLTEYFSQSYHFSNSFFFSKTKEFSSTQPFISSNYFTKSSFFSGSNEFEKTFCFSKTSFFSNSVAFTKSEGFDASSFFTNSMYFTKTDHFTKSNHFSMTKTFKPSNMFSSTNDFSKSNNFSDSNTLLQKSQIVIEIDSDKAYKISTGLKIGLGVIAGTIASSLIILGIIFLLRKKSTPIEDFDEETFEINNSTSISLFSQNPLMDIMNEDDPFDDEFD